MAGNHPLTNEAVRRRGILQTGRRLSGMGTSVTGIGWLGLICLVVGSAGLWACPFCTALSKPLREELATAEHVALAVCEQPAGVDAEFKIHQFRLERSLVGQAFHSGDVLQVYSTAKYQVGDRVLLVGMGLPPQTEWAASEPLGSSAVDYIDLVVDRYKRDELDRYKRDELDRYKRELPPVTTAAGEAELDPSKQDTLTPIAVAQPANQGTSGSPSPTVGSAAEVSWLNLFWSHLESEEAWVRQDCFNAVAQASVLDLRRWVEQLDTDEVIKRLERLDVPIERQRFYWTVLSLCGRSQDSAYARQQLFKVLNDHERIADADPIGLDATISCYLLLGGEPALKEIEQEILQKPERLYSDRYAAIVALRVHAVEFDAFETKRLAQALSLALHDPSIADLVIPDLARMEDWSHVGAFVEMYRKAGESQRYLRVPIVNYLRACPLPAAEQALELCRQIDPDAYRRASVIFPSLPAAISTPKPEQ